MSDRTTENEHNLGQTDVCILAGGLGTRIRAALPDTPKILAPINGSPFIDHLLARLHKSGAQRVIISLGHLADQVISHLEHTSTIRPRGMTIEHFVESSPQGTLGAIRAVRHMLKSDAAMIMNGDTWVDFDLRKLVEYHMLGNADISMLCINVDDVSRYGRVRLSEDDYVLGFEEKTPSAGPGTINAGTYVFSQAILSDIAKTSGKSLEYNFFEKLMPGTISAMMAGATDFIDIGTPESLIAASALMD